MASIYANLLEQKSVCIRKEFNSHRIGLGHQHGRCFIVLGHQYGCRYVMWKHSIHSLSTYSDGLSNYSTHLYWVVYLHTVVHSNIKQTTKGVKSFYKITKTVRALWLAKRSVCMRVCKHGCGVKMFWLSCANQTSTNLKEVSSSKLDKFTLFTHSFAGWNLEIFTNKPCQFFYA